MIKKVVSTGTIERLPGNGHLQQTNMHFSCRSYLIILLTEVREMLYAMYFAAMSLWLSARPSAFCMLAGADIHPQQ